MSDLETQINLAAQKAVLNYIREGEWFVKSYSNKVEIPKSFADECWRLVDTANLKKQVAELIEASLAERIVNSIAAEISSDVKQILSVQERREAIRNIARSHMEAIMKAGSVTV